MLLGFFIGAASGYFQFRLLSVFTKAVTGGAPDMRAVLLGVGQFFLPLVVLLSCAFLLPGSLFWAAAGMVVLLAGCALVRFLSVRKQK